MIRAAMDGDHAILSDSVRPGGGFPLIDIDGAAASFAFRADGQRAAACIQRDRYAQCIAGVRA